MTDAEHQPGLRATAKPDEPTALFPREDPPPPQPPPLGEELADLLALSLIPGVGPARFQRLLERFGSAAAARAAPVSALRNVPGIGERTARAIAHPDEDLDARVEAEIIALDRLGAHVLIRGRPGYPPRLSPLPDAPPLLFVLGRWPIEWPALAVVGSRRCSHRGMNTARRYAAALARDGVTVVSGGARGIDAAAHEGALEAEGSTVVVLGCGLDQVYPPEHADLFNRIVASGRGAVVSELPIGTAPTPANFPARNRIVSGLSDGVLVIEAGSKSGALITARVAVEEHGRQAMAIPGASDDPTAEGCLELIKSGSAEMVYQYAHVSQYMGFTGKLPTQSRQFPLNKPEPRESEMGESSGEKGNLLQAIGDGALFDVLLDKLGCSAADLRAELTMLEVSGEIRREGVIWRRIKP